VTPARTRTRRAFTLIELLVAIALVLALLGALFAFFWDMLSTREQVLEATNRQRAASILIDHLERDLVHCVAGDARAGAGIAGDETSIRVLTRGVPAGRASGSAPADAFGDLDRSSYAFDAAAGTIFVDRHAAAKSAGTAEALGGVVAKVRFRYHDGNAWRPSFDSLRSGALPAAVEVAIWFEPWPGEEAPEVDDFDDFAERETFDAAGGFDEFESAMSSDLELLDEPRPDRVRVIAIPDAGATAPPEEEP
jgi:prepilin-type N-terminal cleavage/methylation domain-containing protein